LRPCHKTGQWPKARYRDRFYIHGTWTGRPICKGPAGPMRPHQANYAHSRGCIALTDTDMYNALHSAIDKYCRGGAVGVTVEVTYDASVRPQQR
jgi:hypothetical protein